MIPASGCARNILRPNTSYPVSESRSFKSVKLQHYFDMYKYKSLFLKFTPYKTREEVPKHSFFVFPFFLCYSIGCHNICLLLSSGLVITISWPLYCFNKLLHSDSAMHSKSFLPHENNPSCNISPVFPS